MAAILQPIWDEHKGHHVTCHVAGTRCKQDTPAMSGLQIYNGLNRVNAVQNWISSKMLFDDHTSH